MVKKSTSKPPKEEIVDLEQLSQQWREKKIALDELAKIEAKLKESIKKEAIKRNMVEGTYYDLIKLEIRENFLQQENLDLANENKIAIPKTSVTQLQLSKSRIDELVKKGHIKADELLIIESVDYSKLELALKEKKIPAFYSQTHVLKLAK
jgi:hypothetical protein